MGWRFFCGNGHDGYTLDEFVAMLPDAKVLPENPITTSPDNRLIVWGAK